MKRAVTGGVGCTCLYGSLVPGLQQSCSQRLRNYCSERFLKGGGGSGSAESGQQHGHSLRFKGRSHGRTVKWKVLRKRVTSSYNEWKLGGAAVVAHLFCTKSWTFPPSPRPCLIRVPTMLYRKLRTSTGAFPGSTPRAPAR